MTQTQATVRNRERPQVVQFGGQDKIDRLAAKAFDLNERQNALKREYDKARKALFEAMDEAGETFRETTADDGRKIKAVIEAPERRVVDPEKIRKHVDESTFLKMVSVSIKDAEKYAGSLILDECADYVAGTPNVSVKKA